MVDKLWFEWQLRFPNQGYLPAGGGPFGQNLTDPMNNTPDGPVGSRPIDVLDSLALGITYDQLLPGTPAPAEPVPGEEGVLIPADGSSHSGDIGVPGEVDLYRFVSLHSDHTPFSPRDRRIPSKIDFRSLPSSPWRSA